LITQRIYYSIIIFNGQRFRCLPEPIIAYNRMTTVVLPSRTDFDPASVLLVFILIDFGKDRSQRS